MSKPESVNKYLHRKAAPEEFERLRIEAGVSIRDFMYLTGRHSAMVAEFQGTRGGEGRREPTMADVMVLELIARNPANYDLAMNIADDYSLGDQRRKANV